MLLQQDWPSHRVVDGAEPGIDGVLAAASCPAGTRVPHPFHGSSTGRNFKVVAGREAAYCHQHDATLRGIHLGAIGQGLIGCADVGLRGALPVDAWRAVYGALREAGYDVPDRARAADDRCRAVILPTDPTPSTSESFTVEGAITPSRVNFWVTPAEDGWLLWDRPPPAGRFRPTRPFGAFQTVKDMRPLRVRMAAQNRDDHGQFRRKVRDQDILKAFDFEATADDPFLTVSEIAGALATHFGIDVSDEAVRVRLQQMLDAGAVDRRQFGPGVAYRALVGPELADDVAARSDERRATPRDEFVEL